MTDLARRVRSALPWLLALSALIALAPIVWVELQRWRTRPPAPSTAVVLRHAEQSLSMAAVGDVVFAGMWPTPGVDRAFDAVSGPIGRASFAVANLEQNLGDSPGPHAGWPLGSPSVSSGLRRWGFTFVTRANNHSADLGATGLFATGDQLEHDGLLHVGAGPDWNAASRPVFLGTTPRRVAMIAVTTSASDEARATVNRGEIAGRPGVNVLRYAAEITADPVTFAALAAMPGVPQPRQEAGADFRLAGRLVRKGERTSVAFVADDRDVSGILDIVTRARALADVVVVAIHSHEPGNLSLTPAPFVEAFARQAVDHGASVVIGTGPRQLRGIEVYKGAPILYSLGNFVFDAASISPEAADAFDANTDLDELALQAPGKIAPPARPSYQEDAWWESVVATVVFEEPPSKLKWKIFLTPIDLGTGVPLKERGRPHIAAPDRGRAILQHLADLSKAYGTTIQIETGLGVISGSD